MVLFEVTDSGESFLLHLLLRQCLRIVLSNVACCLKDEKFSAPLFHSIFLITEVTQSL